VNLDRIGTVNGQVYWKMDQFQAQKSIAGNCRGTVPKAAMLSFAAVPAATACEDLL
jgi:hypothetical protein